MEGIISNFRRARHHTSPTHMIVKLAGIDSRAKAEGLKGKTVIWFSPANKQISGKVASSHGNNGAVRVIFETGMPGQAIGTKVKIE